MFRKVLIANRGEIAVRILRACRALGVRGAAVYSEADRDALHVRMADEAHPVGPAAPGESYLRAERILAAARISGAEAIHPGYGFLSEQAAFAEACERAGLVFVGPSPETLRAAGDKIASRRAAEEAGLPVLPGAAPDGARMGPWREAAERLGYPLLVKAAAGGGGRGMRRVEGPEGLEAALSAARAEARLAFADERVFLEKRFPSVRHVEVQILGDGRGGALHLGERECSVQRRHQKVVEESPAPGLDPRAREGMREEAVRLASRLGYRGAGTVEFLLPEEGGHFFLEVNARLQVEHPVTEMVTGLDLVALQLQVAAEGELPLAQGDVRFSGHAVEARLCAEDPSRDFSPQTGVVRALHLPGGPGVRVDAGVAPGSVVGPHYDSLLAKVVAWGADREAALARLSAALAELRLAGLCTNQAFLAALAAHPAFREGALSTEFLARHPEVLDPPFPENRLEEARLAAALGRYLAAGELGGRAAGDRGEPKDPWARPGPWLPGGAA